MNFKLKALVAALALAAAVPAQAAFDPSSGGNGSLILTVYDRVAAISATFDLGKNYSDFSIAGTSFPNSGVTTSGTTFSWNLASNANYAPAWTQFLAAATVPNIFYAIGAGDNVGSGAGNRGFISTYTSLEDITTGRVLNISSNFDAYAAANQTTAETLFSNHQTAEDGSSVATATASYGGIFYTEEKNFGVGSIAAAGLGTDMGVFQYTTASGNFLTAPITVFGNNAKFNLDANGALSYSVAAPIPEVDTWAMMMLGLGFMGFVARRKQA